MVLLVPFAQLSNLKLHIFLHNPKNSCNFADENPNKGF